MLSSAPAIPLQSIDFLNGGNGRRLSLVTASGREFLTNRDGLPSPNVLTPIEGHTPADTPPESATPSETGTPPESEGTTEYPGVAAAAASAQHDRRKSMFGDIEDGGSIRKVPSRGGIWHDNVSDVLGLGLYAFFSYRGRVWWWPHLKRVGGFRIRWLLDGALGAQ